MRFLTGTRALSKKVSLKPCCQPMLISGRNSTPARSVGISSALIPRCFGASGSVRTGAQR